MKTFRKRHQPSLNVEREEGERPSTPTRLRIVDRMKPSPKKMRIEPTPIALPPPTLPQEPVVPKLTRTLTNTRAVKTFRQSHSQLEDDIIQLPLSEERDLEDSDDEGSRTRMAHELQQLGENKQFEDDMLYILDGLQPTQPMGVQLITMRTLLDKLTAKEFSSRFRGSRYVAQIVRVLCVDCMLPMRMAAVATVLYCLSHEEQNVDQLVREPTFLGCIGKLLEAEVDAFAEMDAHKGPNKRHMDQLMKHIALKEVSLASLVLVTLSSVLSGMDALAMDTAFQNQLLEVGITKTCAELLIDHLDADTEYTITNVQLRHILTILEKATFGHSGNQQAVGLIIPPRLLATCTTCCTYLTTAAEDVVEPALCFLAAVLRLLINLTNDYRPCSLVLLQSNGIHQLANLTHFTQQWTRGHDQPMQDISLLCVGLWIHLMDDADTFHTWSIDELDVLPTLIEWYASLWHDQGLLSTYLAILLGCIALASPALKETIRTQLDIPGRQAATAHLSTFSTLLGSPIVHSLSSMIQAFE